MKQPLTHWLTSKTFWLSLLVLLLALLPRVTTLGNTFIVNDEPLYWEWSNQFATALVNFDWQGTLIGKGYPAITVMWVHTLGAGCQFIIEMLLGYPLADFWQRLDQPFIFERLGQKRLVMGIANALLIWLIFLRASKLLGDGIAFGGTLLMAFAPFLLADARTMRGDALLSSLMLLSFLDLLIFLRERHYWRLIVSGVTFGLALLTKMTALPLAGIVGLAVGVYILRQAAVAPPMGREKTKAPTRPTTPSEGEQTNVPPFGGLGGPASSLTHLRWGFITLLIWGSVTLITVFLFWPALWVSPLEVFLFMQQYAASSIDGRLNFFWGELTHDEPLPLFYPNAFLFRANPIVVLGVVVITGLCLVTAWRWLRQRRGGGAGLPSDWLDRIWRMPVVARWTVLALSAYSVLYWLVLNVGALKRDRYLMPIFPAVMFVAAAGLWWLVTWAARRWPGYGLPPLLAKGRWAWGALLLLVGLEMGHVLASHPFYYTYWSPLMGGGRVAMDVMMAEGGIDSVALVNLNQRPTAAQEQVALLTARDYAPAFTGEAVRLTTQGRWVMADHIVVRQYHYQTEKMEPYLLEYLYRRPPEDVVEYQGYVWAWTYPGPGAEYYAGSLLDGQVHLLGYNLNRQTASPEMPLHLKLFWQNRGYQSASEQFFVRLVDGDGFIWADTTAHPLPTFEAVADQPEAIVESEATLTIPPGTPPGLYFLKLGLRSREENIDIGQFTLPDDGNQIAIEKSPPPASLTVERPVEQPLSHDLTLIGADLDPSLILTPQTPQPVTLYWRATATVTEEYLVSLQLFDAAGQEAAAWVGRPARGLYPPSQWQPGEVVRDPWRLDLRGVEELGDVNPSDYRLRVSLLVEATGQVVGETDLGEIAVSDRRRLFETPPLDHTADIRLGQAISLLGYNLSQAPLTGGARLTVKLYWQTQQPLDQNYTVFVQVLGPDGMVVGQHDSPPADGKLPTSIWDSGEVIPDRHLIDFPIAQNGDYQVIVGMYDPITGERLPRMDAQDAPVVDSVQIHTFTSDAIR